MPGLLAIMGSGETAPTMVRTHRALFERVGDRPAVLLDTPYGFQSNADDISHRAVSYFAASVGRTIGVVTWRIASPPGLARERASAALREAGWIFAGPGSPTYALRQWRDTVVHATFGEVLARDGVVVLASAAALTLGSHTVPVYEIYKAGIDPHWVAGLNLVEAMSGLPAVVIPHYDNAEGGNHDTRFCYLGEQRLARLEAELPDASFVLGVDEHTAVLLDPDARTATVVGNGVMTIRKRGQSAVHQAGCVISFDDLATVVPASIISTVPASVAKNAATAVTSTPMTSTAETSTAAMLTAATSMANRTGRAATSLRATADEIAARFDGALATRDVDGCVEAVLALEQALLDWSADTLSSDEGDHARSRLRAMVVRLGELATVGARDPREVVGPFVDALLDIRAKARATKDFATSDQVRDALTTAGIEVRDTPDGVQWRLPSTDAAVAGSAVAGSAVAGSAVAGSAVAGSAVAGSAVTGSAVTGSAVTDSAEVTSTQSAPTGTAGGRT